MLDKGKAGNRLSGDNATVPIRKKQDTGRQGNERQSERQSFKNREHGGDSGLELKPNEMPRVSKLFRPSRGS